ncbi:MAG: lipopolysaccharide heptosyltransferase II [Candidatus Marinimicrobia bacterium]|nr:lipopolysaccharide heptosyltransferase II [Candidatus Neomarinimicrobiota bacterium]|tara:strand:- start:24500 stop:25477 length:978 start_codon:yes stop_codon:yes gene_type:complete
MNIGVYSPNWIGDAVMALPFLKELKGQYPNGEIKVFCKDWVAAIYKNNPSVNKIISVSDRKINGFFNSINIGYQLKVQEFDLFFTLTDSARSALILWMSGAKKRFGFNSQMRSIFLTNSIIQPNPKIHRSKKYLTMLNNNIVSQPKIYISEEEKEWASSEMGKYSFNLPIALSPYSVSSVRNIPNNIIRKWLKNSNEQYIVFGSKSDIKKAEDLIKSCKNISLKSFCGKYSLRQSMALISLCKYTLATDSGLGHVSSALGIPTISFFGAGNPKVTGPIGDKNIIIKHCYPCMGDKCNNFEDEILCIKNISKIDIDNNIKNIFLEV